MHNTAQRRQVRAVVIRNATRVASWMRRTIALALSNKKERTKEAVAAQWTKLKNRKVDRAQWRRWFQANRKYQRQLAAMRRCGYRHSAELGGLPRWAVR